MKTIVLTKVLLLTVAMAFADGFVTKTNQSAQYARMLSRNASTGIDAAILIRADCQNLHNFMSSNCS